MKAYDLVLKMCVKRGDDISSEEQAVSEMPLRLATSVDGSVDGSVDN